MARRSGPRSLTAAVQLAQLKAIGFSGSTRRDVLDVIGELTPTPWSGTYTVQIRYKLGYPPQVTVENLELRPLDDSTPIPHVYTDPLALCLYLPGAGEWGPADKLTETIVPWANEWLVYYEAWRTTGKWLGGGLHPRAQRKNRRRSWTG